MNKIKVCIRVRDPDPDRGMDYADFFTEMEFPFIPEEGQNLESHEFFMDARVKKVSWDVDNSQYKLYLDDHLVCSEHQPEFFEIYEDSGWIRKQKRN